MTSAGSLSFPDFEEGSRLPELVQQIASALSTAAGKPIGSVLEVFVRFDDYPEAFGLWWDGFNCELGSTEPDLVDMETIVDSLRASRKFEVSE